MPYYDEPYHDIIRQCLQQGLDFGMDGSFLLIGDTGQQLAESILGFSNAKVVVDPISETDAEAFRQAGYRICSLAGFSLTDILHETIPV